MDIKEFDLIPTNSLISSAFNALKSDAVEDPYTDVLSISAMNMEESAFVSSIEYLKKMNEFFMDSKLKLYKALAENTTDTTVMLESFSDYYVQMDAIIQKFLKFLRFKIDDCIATVTNYMDETKIISEHKKALTEEIKFYENDSIEGYNFTIEEDVPDVSVLDNFNASLFDQLYKPGMLDMTVDSVKQTVTAMELENDIRVFRAKILGIDGTLSDSEFIRQVYMIFRDNVSNMIELNIDAKTIRDIAEKWFKHYEFKSELNKQYTQIEKAYDGVLKKIEKLTQNNHGMSIAAFTNIMPGDIGVTKIEGKDIDAAGTMMSPDMMLQIDIYTKAKIDQLQKYTDITCMVMAAKMDAIKDMIRQDRSILLSAIEVLDHPESYYDARSTGKKVPDNLEDTKKEDSEND